MDNGLFHLYYGDGKGKTSSAVGLSVRALGRGKAVTFVQFLKDGFSGEIEPLRRLGAVILSGQPGTKFVFQMDDAEKAVVRDWNDRILREAMETPCELLVLDELCTARQFDLVDRDLAMQAVLERPAEREIVITGREPEPWMLEAADYITDMRCRRHPYDAGISARPGIEY